MQLTFLDHTVDRILIQRGREHEFALGADVVLFDAVNTERVMLIDIVVELVGRSMTKAVGQRRLGGSNEIRCGRLVK